ncbi:NAD(P)H-binding protein [Aureibacter tunicatorum]|uniref:NADH-flavin reductase n=1 Tax=Aureibacter tunicatorum TaxID=866807 RepID=A0AAE3XJI1_9BACT|nr:NAD(P)H-binding protein [Aureibacter tunicatorum]MDR6237173.1 putative NADH-flavin reductase [Aureibacter tunicatorum]BDD06165.1 hypothetical protein AUTU_36480 [Aureibacter tunicatorum]
MAKQITIFGATGFVGKKLIRLAIERGYKIKALARSKNKLKEFESKIEIIEGDYFDLNKIDEAIHGSSAILSTIGPPLKAKGIDESKYHDSLNHLINRLEKKGSTKFINISGAAIKFPDEKLSFKRKALRLMLNLMAQQMINVKDGELEILTNSNIDFISIRPPMIKDIQGEYSVNDNSLVSMSVGVDQICNFMLDNIDNDQWRRKAPLIGNI